jgi:urease accessory protein
MSPSGTATASVNAAASVTATALAVVEAGGVLRRVRSAPPITLRQVLSDDPDECSLCLVGTAAGPLSGDRRDLELVVGEGARARLAATGAALSQGRAGVPARLSTTVRLAAGAVLVADPGPLIVCAGGSVQVRLTVELADDASLQWRELLVLGRTGEPPGAATLRWQVDRSGVPLLRQEIDLTDPELLAWPGLLAGRRVLGTALLVGPGIVARTVVGSATAVAQRLADQAVLVTVLGDDAADATQRLSALCSQVLAGP